MMFLDLKGSALENFMLISIFSDFCLTSRILRFDKESKAFLWGQVYLDIRNKPKKPKLTAALDIVQSNFKT